jgi:bacterial/archaeal transporter family-2 protein
MWAMVIVAALGGVAVAVQAQFMGIMDRGMGTLESVFITYGVGAMVIGLVMVVSRGGNLGVWPNLPWYTLFSGICGLIIVGCIGFSAPRMGVVPALTVLTAAQFIVAALIDHFGLWGADTRPVTAVKTVGMILVLAGVRLLVR